MIYTLALIATIGITFLGAFSRFTHGQYTPAFYKYQLDRAPDNESTRYVPMVDAALFIMLLFPKTRAIAALLAFVFQGIGLRWRMQEDKPIAPDAALALTALVAFWGCLFG